MLSSITPSTVPAGSPGMVLTAAGSNFVAGSEITWNGIERATLYVSSTSLQMNLTPTDLASSTTVMVGVTDPADAGGASSATVPFSITQNTTPNPFPSITSLTPSSAQTGDSATTISVAGANFVPSSAVRWNAMSLATTYQSASSLTAVIPASDLTSAGTSQITVLNPAPGGGTSNALAFLVDAAGSQGQSVINLPANDLAWDPVRQVIYLSLPSFTGLDGNSIQVLKPVTSTIDNSVFAGSEPDLLAVSSTGKYLYVALDGASSLQRFVLPGLTPDINISFGPAGFSGPYFAMDLQPSPIADGTSAFVLGNVGVSPEEEGGVQIYDDSVERPNVLCGFIEEGCTETGQDFGGLYDSIQWNAAADTMFALNNEDTGFDFYVIPVNAQGFGTVKDDGALAAGFGDALHYDATTSRLYTDYGVVIDAATGEKAGSFDAAGLAVPDGKNGVIFFIGQPDDAFGTSTFTIESFDINHFTPIATMTVKNVVGTPTHLIRWGTNGLAFTTFNDLAGTESGQPAGAVYLISGSFVGSSGSSGVQPLHNVRRSWSRRPSSPTAAYTHRAAPVPVP